MRRDVSVPAPTLRVERLCKHFVPHLRGGGTRVVLRDVHLEVDTGECVALVGPSGQGKSTLMKCLYGNYGIDAGSAVLQSQNGPVDLAQATPQQVGALRRRDMAYVSQFLRALPRVPTLQLVAERAIAADEAAANGVVASDDLEADPPQAAAARAHAAALLERLNLPPALWTLPPATFSGGEQQRVNLARGFIVPSRLLLLDEPTASLDAANRAVVVDLILEARAAGAAIVGIFHDETVRDAVATRCVDLAALQDATP